MGNHLASNFVKELPTYVIRAVKRKTRRFSVIPRTEKLIDKIQEKPTRAPLYEATRKQVEQLVKEHPEKLNELSDKDENLNKNLENIYVKSTGQNTEIFSKARLPDSYGYRVMRTREPERNVPEGKYNSTRAEHFLAAHERDPKVYSAETLAGVYKVDAEAMKNILEYVKVYSVALPMKKTRGPNAMTRMAQDMIPGGLFHEPEARILERKVQLAKDKMAKLYNQPPENREKLLQDMNMFESLVALKPMVKKVKEEIMEGITGAKSIDELTAKSASKLIYKPESKDDASYNLKNVNDDSFVGKTKEKLVKYGILESREEIMEQREAAEIKAKVNKDYINPHESIAEYNTISTPQTEEDDHFAKQTQRQLENIPLLEDKKRDDEKKILRLESSNDSAEVENVQSEDSKIQYKEKLSDKG